MKPLPDLDARHGRQAPRTNRGQAASAARQQTTIQPKLFSTPQIVTTSDDCYTPAELFQTMATTFDLDVAAPPGGVPWIPANRHFSQADDGLSQPWNGRVWMNPPFTNIAPWVNRFIAHANGIALLPFSKSKWTADIWYEADAVVLIQHQDQRFPFIKNGKPHTIFMPVWLAAIGHDNATAIARVGHAR